MPSHPFPGCAECERLMNKFALVVDEDAQILRQYHTALQERDLKTVDVMRDAVEGCDLIRRQVKEELLAHQATHGQKKPATQI